eukprot:c19263_g1_i2.p1 GENE.c19263_g1_i2~~c19263_g1_i2.p1  ORF type:complete len:708 (+),score=134.21 c19263_g1_i2:248-2371(+)
MLPVREPCPVTLLCGFLGSGKTTLLEHVLHNKESMRIGLLVNDMASVNVDAAIVKKISGEQDMTMLQNGCVCCELKGDMIREVEAIASRSPTPDAILVEASGISLPKSMITGFVKNDTQVLKNARLDTVVTVVDATRFVSDFSCLEGVGDRQDWVDIERALKSDKTRIVNLLVDQVEGADVVVVSKCDLVTEDMKARVIQLVSQLNPTALLIEAVFGRVRLSDILNTKRFQLGVKRKTIVSPFLARSGMSAMSSFIYRAQRPFHPERLHALIRGWRSERVMRSKGFVSVLDRPKNQIYYWSHAGYYLKLQEASTGADTTPQDANALTEIVFIGQNLNQAAITHLLDQCVATDEEVASTAPIPNSIVPVPDPQQSLMQAEAKVRGLWVRRAVALSIFTVLWNICEGAVSISFATDDESISLLGFGIDAIVEVVSALLVLHRLFLDKRSRAKVNVTNNHHHNGHGATAAVIGVLLLVLGLSTVVASSIGLAKHQTPHSTLAGIIVSVVSLTFMSSLYAAKVKAAVMLQSDTLAADATCSLGCLLLSIVLFAGSLLFRLSSSLWFIDSACAIVIGLLIAHEGANTLKARLLPMVRARFSKSVGATLKTTEFEMHCCGGTMDSKIYQAVRRRAYTTAGTLRVFVPMPPAELLTASQVDAWQTAGAGAPLNDNDPNVVDVDAYQDKFVAQNASDSNSNSEVCNKGPAAAAST